MSPVYTFDPSFSDVFFDGLGLSTQTPSRYPVALFGRGLYIDVNKYERRTLPLVRPGTDQGGEAGESSRSNEGFWYRAGVDWTQGAGQRFFDRSGANRRRFWSSKGIDPWTEGEIHALKDTTRTTTSAETNLHQIKAGDYVFRSRGAVLERSTDYSSWTAITTTGITTITGIAADGTSVYICDGAKIMSGLVTAASLANLGAYAADRIWYANGRLLASDGAALVEISAAGAATVLTMANAAGHIGASWVWTSVEGTTAGIFAAGYGSGQSEVWNFSVAAGGALAAGTIAMPFVADERINTLDFYGGFVFLGTSIGVRVAEISGTTLNYGPVIEIGDVQCFAFSTDNAWFGWTNYDSTSTGLGRLNLDALLEGESLVFPYASDLMATAQGAVQSVVRLGTRLHFGVSGSGYWSEHATNRVTTGTLDTGWITYGDSDDKRAVGATIRHDPLTGAISLSIIEVDDTVTVLGESTTANTLRPAGTFAASIDSAERFQLRITLTPTVATNDPTLTMWRLLALPAGVRTDEIILPVLLSASVYEEPFDVQEYLSWLKTLEADQSLGTYQEGTDAMTVIVSGVSRDPGKWNDDTYDLEGLVFVRLLTMEL